MYVPTSCILLQNLQLCRTSYHETSYTSVATTLSVVHLYCSKMNVFCSSRRHCSAHTVPVATQTDESAVVHRSQYGGGQFEGGGIWRCTALQWTFAFNNNCVCVCVCVCVLGRYTLGVGVEWESTSLSQWVWPPWCSLRLLWQQHWVVCLPPQSPPGETGFVLFVRAVVGEEHWGRRVRKYVQQVIYLLSCHAFLHTWQGCPLCQQMWSWFWLTYLQYFGSWHVCAGHFGCESCVIPQIHIAVDAAYTLYIRYVVMWTHTVCSYLNNGIEYVVRYISIHCYKCAVQHCSCTEDASVDIS